MGTENQDLRKAGLKVTLPRIKVLQLLENTSGDAHHMSAEDVYKALLEAGEDVGLATVYRVLTQFETAGLVVRHNFEGGHSVFEIADGDHHDHMVCTKCGLIVEFVDQDIGRFRRIRLFFGSFDRLVRHIQDQVVFGLSDNILGRINPFHHWPIGTANFAESVTQGCIGKCA